MKKSILILLGVLISYIGYSQTQFYINPSNGDTLKLFPFKTTPVPPIPPVTTVNVGDGSSNLIIDGGNYKAGTLVIVKSGTYNKGSGITIQNCNGITIQGTGVIIDGLNQTQAGYYNCLTISNVNNTTISGFTVQNNGYHAFYINSKCTGMVWTGLSFINNLQGGNIAFTSIWDKTDNTVTLLNCAIRNCIFNNSSFLGAGNMDGKNVTNLIKNIEISGCTFSNTDGGNVIQIMVDGFNIFNNTCKNLNSVSNLDNRNFMLVGNGVAHDNTFDTIEGHAIGLNPVSFGSIQKDSRFYNNKITNSRRYAAFEMQEFVIMNIPGVTSKSNLTVDSNVFGNGNTDHWTGYPATFIDNYQDNVAGILGCQVTLTNNIGYNWFPVPTSNQHLWNLSSPTVNTGNTYTATKP